MIYQLMVVTLICQCHLLMHLPEVLRLIRQQQPLLSFVLTADHAIPEAAARVHDLRTMGFHILTTIMPEAKFRGVIRRNAALYSFGTPEWPRPGFLDEKGADDE